MQTKIKSKNKSNITANEQFHKLIDIRINETKNIIGNRREKNKTNSNVELFAIDCLKELPPIKIKSLLKLEQFEYVDSIIDLIRDIYPHIKDDISIFLPTKIFNEKTDPHDFFDWIISRYLEVNKFTDWAIEYSGDKYYLVCYEDMDISVDGHSVSASFLEELRYKNRKLHNLFIGFLSLLHHKFNVPMWFDDYSDTNSGLDFLKDEIDNDIDDEEFKEIKALIKKYEKGVINTIAQEIKSLYISVENFKFALNNYNPTKDTNKKQLNFLKKWVSLFDYNCSFLDFIYVSKKESEDGIPPTPENYAGINWELNTSKDRLADFIEWNYQSMCENSFDIIPFRKVIVNNEDSSHSDFPKKYVEMLDELCFLF